MTFSREQSKKASPQTVKAFWTFWTWKKFHFYRGIFKEKLELTTKLYQTDPH